MAIFYFNYDDPSRERFRIECETVEQARNEAVRHLGSYLMEHPGFASEGHWRVNVEDAFGTVLLHVIVATVMANGTAGAG